ncbi:MAG: hypothetical protein NC408_04675 [Candidatus Gastranaerophilales bacterium]|nr:hypothetical protein [Candidatus Gastranaerophilales bacterium]MCM1072523.1 hypothetical protein [Bacteroides sp.]
MKVQSINPAISAPMHKRNSQCFKGNSEINPQDTAVKALTTFGIWFGFGVGLDFLSRKIHFSKSPAKNSFAINGIISSIAGGYVLAKELYNKKADTKS